MTLFELPCRKHVRNLHYLSLSSCFMSLAFFTHPPPFAPPDCPGGSATPCPIMLLMLVDTSPDSMLVGISPDLMLVGTSPALMLVGISPE